jgi:uncharacterized protein (TIGR00661 family)
MKILYAIQGTGNGHLSRARDIIPALQKRTQVDVLISGQQADLDLPFEVKYRYQGLSFIFGKKGGIDFWATFKRNKLATLFKEINECPVQDYDLIINDFEPISAWAAKLVGIPSISLSHQCALQSKQVPRPTHRDFISNFILKYYAPCKENYGFHFKKYDKNIFSPVIRKEIRELEETDLGHYTVYLPAYSDEKIIDILSLIPKIQWQVFSKHSKKAYRKGNVHIEPIDSDRFINSMASCQGVLCGAGFETPAEAMYLNKKLMVIPMQGQYEQHYNAQSLKEFGVPVLKKLKKKHIKRIRTWVTTDKKITVYYPNQTQFIVDHVIEQFIASGQMASKSQFKPAIS